MRTVLVSALAIVAASFAAPIDAPVNDLAVRSSSNCTSYFYVSNLTGGSGGNVFSGPLFSDLLALCQQTKIPKITFFESRGDKRVDHIYYEVDFPNGSFGHYDYGGDGGNPTSIKLDEGEFINEVQLQLTDELARRQTEPGDVMIPHGGRNSRRAVGSVIDPPSAIPDSHTVSGSKPFVYDSIVNIDPHSETNDFSTGFGSKLPPGYDQSPGIDQAPRIDPEAGVSADADIGGRVNILGAEFKQEELANMKAEYLVLPYVFVAIVGGLAIGITETHHHKSQRLQFMRIKTSSGHMLQQGTPNGNQMHTFTPPDGYTRLVGFLGRSGNEVDAIAPIWG